MYRFRSGMRSSRMAMSCLSSFCSFVLTRTYPKIRSVFSVVVMCRYKILLINWCRRSRPRRRDAPSPRAIAFPAVPLALGPPQSLTVRMTPPVRVTVTQSGECSCHALFIVQYFCFIRSPFLLSFIKIVAITRIAQTRLYSVTFERFDYPMDLDVA